LYLLSPVSLPDDDTTFSSIVTTSSNAAVNVIGSIWVRTGYKCCGNVPISAISRHIVLTT
jgi:hypothetical protein